MDRYLLDINQLPSTKSEVIKTITSAYSEAQKNAFIKSLIFLGFATIKQADIDVTSANIGKSKGIGCLKFRINLSNTPIASFLATFKNQTTRRSCVYAFLYAGISSYIEYMSLLDKTPSEKSILNKIEKNLFMCGLGDHISQKISITLKPTPENSPPTLTKERAGNQRETMRNKPQKSQHTEAIVNVDEKPAAAPEASLGSEIIKPHSKKLSFNIDGV